jgi:uncharacterized protein
LTTCLSHPENPSQPRNPSILGKAILFARAPLTFPTKGPWNRSLAPIQDIWAIPAFADIPQPGQQILAHQPILTLFSAGDSIAGCADRLKQMAADLDRLLFPS